MPDFGIRAGDTSKTVYLRLRDSTTGLAKTGLAWNSSGATASYTLPGAAAVSITLASLASPSDAWSSGGFVEVNATLAKGLYRLDLPDAAVASGDFTVISIEFDGIIEESMEIPLAVPIDLPSIPANWITSAGIAAAALDGKGDWGDATIANQTSIASDVSAVKTTTDKMVFTTANQLDVQVISMGTDSLTADAAAADFIGASEIAASASQEIADLIAADWVAGDASPLAIVAALKADAEWSNLATLATQIGTAGDGLTAIPGLGGGDGSGLTAVPWNPAWDAEVQSECDDALVNRGLHWLIDVPLAQSWWFHITPGSALDQIVAKWGGEFDRDSLSLEALYEFAVASRAEPGQGTPAEDPDFLTKIDYLYKYLINKAEQDSEFFRLYNSGGSQVDQQRSISDSGPGGMTTRGQLVTGQ